MDIILDILLDSFLDTVKLIPFLFFVYFLIELLEFKNVFKFEKSKLLTGKASPVVGSCFGIVPQCGFSVISAELFAEHKISIAALVSVFLATSDEAFPILISNYKSIPVLIALLVSKFLIALIVGYFILFLTKFLYKNSPSKNIDTHEHHEEHDEHKNHDEHGDHVEHEHHDEHNKNEKHHNHLHACCHHDIEDQQKFNWKHPLVHCFKIALYIFIVNIILSAVFALIGEENISDFLTHSSLFQPLFALIIGFIPNCASSVILTELYMQGMLTFGSIITGLCANAGIGLFVLFKENKNTKENIFIVLSLVVSSLIFGYILHFIPFNFV